MRNRTTKRRGEGRAKNTQDIMRDAARGKLRARRLAASLTSVLAAALNLCYFASLDSGGSEL